jgi:anti-sigma factor RsiW
MHPDDELLNAYADGSIDPAGRADLERHLASCASCRRTVDDLRAILRATASLELREPPVRAWPRIERAIKLDSEHASRKRGSAPLLWMAAAAALVLAAVVGVRYSPPRGPDTAAANPPTAGANAAAGEAAQSVEIELRQAEAHYENAIRGLEQIANTERNALDPRTAATLQKNLAVIDQAISESRAAVRSQPSSGPAQESLIENFKAKIGLLQDTVALINEMRKGNEAGAARIVSGLKEKGN